MTVVIEPPRPQRRVVMIMSEYQAPLVFSTSVEGIVAMN